MKIQFNTDKTIIGNEKHEEYFSPLIAEGLKRFETYITRIEVHLSDENGKKEGPNDKLCMLEARLEGKQPIAVTCQEDIMEQAVSGSIHKLQTSLKTIIGRERNF